MKKYNICPYHNLQAQKEFLKFEYPKGRISRGMFISAIPGTDKNIGNKDLVHVIKIMNTCSKRN